MPAGPNELARFVWSTIARASPTRPGRSSSAIVSSFAPRLALDQPGGPRPAVLGAQHGDRQLGGVRMSHNAALVEVLAGLLHLHVADQRGHDRLVDPFGA